jgi:hypothetical protein
MKHIPTDLIPLYAHMTSTMSELRDNVNKFNEYGYTPLMSFIRLDYFEHCENMLKCYDVDIDLQNPDGVTALSLSIIYRKFEFVKLLVRHNAKIGNKDIILAKYLNDNEIVKYLENHIKLSKLF